MLQIAFDHVVEEDAITGAASNTTEASFEQHNVSLILENQNRRLLEMIVRVEGQFGHDLKVTSGRVVHEEILRLVCTGKGMTLRENSQCAGCIF